MFLEYQYLLVLLTYLDHNKSQHRSAQSIRGQSPLDQQPYIKPQALVMQSGECFFLYMCHAPPHPACWCLRSSASRILLAVTAALLLTIYSPQSIVSAFNLSSKITQVGEFRAVIINSAGNKSSRKSVVRWRQVDRVRSAEMFMHQMILRCQTVICYMQPHLWLQHNSAH